MDKAKLYFKRALHTFVQAGLAAALTALGTYGITDEVEWKTVIITALIAGCLSLIKSSAIGVPENEENNDDEAVG